MLTIPTRTDLPHYFQTVTLEGKSYGLELYWNTRDRAWFLSVWDSAFATRLLAGRRLSVNVQVLGRFRDPRLPPGELTVIDLSGAKVDPGLEELGQRVVLVYAPLAELPA